MSDIAVINKAFKEIQYYDKEHIYTYNGKKIPSVTQLIKKYEKPFEADYHATRIANKENRAKILVEGEWHMKRVYGTTKGNIIHNFLEHKLQRKEFEFEIPEFLHKPSVLKCLHHCQQYVKDCDLIPVANELVVGNEFVAGQIDYLGWRDGYVLHDFKGLALDTLIPTPSGYTKMKDIRVGDFIYNGDGEITKVKHVSEVHYNPCYKITLSTNETVIADHEHKWVVEENLNSGEFECTTEDLYNHYVKNNTYNTLRINNINPIQTVELDLEVDPYVLGIWLGDGNRHDGKVVCTNSKIWEEIENRGYKTGNNLQKDSAKPECKTIYKLRTGLRKLGVLKNKHIPEIYLRASYKQRLDLLRGYMDADGSYNKSRKRFVMITTSETQANNLAELVSTFGDNAIIIPAKTSGFGKKDIPTFHVCFTSVEFPFLCRNNEFNTEEEINRRKTNYRNKFKYIKKVEKVDTVPTKCIAVEGENKTYLFGRGLTKTHNTDRKLEYSSFYGEKFKSPLSHLDKCEINKYRIQTSMYKKLFEEATGFTIKEIEIVWINEQNDSYKIIPIDPIENIEKLWQQSQNIFLHSD